MHGFTLDRPAVCSALAHYPHAPPGERVVALAVKVKVKCEKIDNPVTSDNRPLALKSGRASTTNRPEQCRQKLLYLQLNGNNDLGGLMQIQERADGLGCELRYAIGPNQAETEDDF